MTIIFSKGENVMYQEALMERMDNYGCGPEELADLTWTSEEVVYDWLENGMTSAEYCMVCRILQMKTAIDARDKRIYTYEMMLIGEE